MLVVKHFVTKIMLHKCYNRIFNTTAVRKNTKSQIEINNIFSINIKIHTVKRKLLLSMESVKAFDSIQHNGFETNNHRRLILIKQCVIEVSTCYSFDDRVCNFLIKTFCNIRYNISDIARYCRDFY